MKGDPIRIIPGPEAVPGSGSIRVEFSDGREPVRFYYDDVASRRLRPDAMTKDQAIAAAKEFARRAGSTKGMKVCLRCDNARFVCEAHPDLPWEDGPRACPCGAPGEPCPVCNRVDEGEVPEMPEGFVTVAKRDW